MPIRRFMLWLTLALSLALIGSASLTSIAAAQTSGSMVVRIESPTSGERLSTTATITGVAVNCTTGQAATRLRPLRLARYRLRSAA